MIMRLGGPGRHVSVANSSASGRIAVQRNPREGQVMQKHEHVSAYELLMVALSIYVLLALLIQRVFSLSTQTSEIVHLIDTAVCTIFLADFFVQLGTASNKLRYLRWGWIDLISSIPMFPVLRWGRMVRIVRVVRVLRGFRAARILTSVIFAHRAKGALATALFVCIVLVTFGSVTILQVETDPQSNIRTPGDALWWSLATIATVGYGDKYPVTGEGRALAILLMTGGIGLFGTFTGYLATWFMEADPTADKSIMKVAAEIGELRFQVQQLRTELGAARQVPELTTLDVASSLPTVAVPEIPTEAGTFLPGA